MLQAAASWDSKTRAYVLGILASWMLLSKVVKLLGHFIRYPIDVVFIPISILFGYTHGFLKLYAMFTLDVVSTSLRPQASYAKRVICHALHMNMSKFEHPGIYPACSASACLTRFSYDRLTLVDS